MEGKTAAAGALKTLSTGDANQVAVASAGGIEALIKLLQTESSEANIVAAGALRNLSANDNNKLVVAQAGGFEPLMDLLRTGTPEGKTVAAEALSNLTANENLQEYVVHIHTRSCRVIRGSTAHWDHQREDCSSRHYLEPLSE